MTGDATFRKPMYQSMNMNTQYTTTNGSVQ